MVNSSKKKLKPLTFKTMYVCMKIFMSASHFKLNLVSLTLPAFTFYAPKIAILLISTEIKISKCKVKNLRKGVEGER